MSARVTVGGARRKVAQGNASFATTTHRVRAMMSRAKQAVLTATAAAHAKGAVASGRAHIAIIARAIRDARATARANCVVCLGIQNNGRQYL